MRAPAGRAARSPATAEGPAPSQAPEALPSVSPLGNDAIDGGAPPAPGPTACEPMEPPGSPPSLIFSALDGPDVWLAAARSSLLNLLATAREGARRPHKRVLSRAEIRRQAREAFTAASSLLDEAAVALRVAAPRVISRRTSSR